MIGNYYDTNGNLVDPSNIPLINGSIEQGIGNKIADAIGGKIDVITQKVSDGVVNFLIHVSGLILDVVAVGVVGYIFYLCVCYIFFGKSEIIQKMMFSIFGLILIRVFNTIIVGGGFYGTQ